jgi:hypothetical protein
MLLSLSCSEEIDFGEQYKKTVYIVNSGSILYTGEHTFGKESDEIVVSVYCASSEPITDDLKVRLKIDRNSLDSLNNLNRMLSSSYIDKVMLPQANYTLEGEPHVTIKAGEQYGTLRIPFRFDGLNPDVSYTLPVSLVSNAAGYDINPGLKSIVYEIKMINKYSGDYAGSSQESATTIFGVQPTLKALSANTVRMPVHNLPDDQGKLKINYMVLTIADDGSVSIAPFGFAEVTDLGGSFYDAVKQRFELHYKFTDANSRTVTVTEIIKNLNAPEEEFED